MNQENAFQMGERQKKNWFQETKENLLQQVSEKPLKFIFWTGLLGTISVYYSANFAADAVEKALDIFNWMHTPQHDAFKEWMDRVAPPATSHTLPQNEPIQGIDVPWNLNSGR